MVIVMEMTKYLILDLLAMPPVMSKGFLMLALTARPIGAWKVDL
jgi:hypothetical protein